jgi:diguanylate cyclase (GGDEF)-like protein
MTLRSRLTLVLALLVALPLTVAALIVGLTVPSTLRAMAEDGLAVTRGGVESAIAARCDRALLAARSLGLHLATAQPSDAVRDTTQTTGVDYAALVDHSGRPVAAAGPPPAGGTAAPLNCSDGQAAGAALVAQVPLQVEGRRDLEGAVTAQTLDRGALMAIQSELGTRAQIALLLDGEPVSSTMPGDDLRALADGVSGLAATDGSVKVGDWLAVVAQPGKGQPFTVVVAERPASGESVWWAVLVIVLVAVAAAVVVARALARSLTRPLDELTQAASGVAAGDLAIKLPARGEDEVGRLSAAFNNMTAALRLSMTALQRSRDETRLSWQRLGDALSSTHDLEGICHVTVETAVSAIAADAGLVVLVNGQGDLERVSSVGFGGDGLRPPGELTPGSGVLAQVIADDHTIRARLGSEVGPDVNEPGEGHVLAAPLRRKSGVVGALAVYVAADNGFDDGDEATLRTLTHQASIAIDNAILHIEAERMSVTDALTGVANYRYLMAGLSREVERASRFGRPLAVLMLDLDHFKEVNDAYGHERGNVVLRELAQRVRGQIRDIDTVARYGGEEFVLLLPETGAEGAARVAQRVCEAVRAKPFGGPGAEAEASAGEEGLGQASVPADAEAGGPAGDAGEAPAASPVGPPLDGSAAAPAAKAGQRRRRAATYADARPGPPAGPAPDAAGDPFVEAMHAIQLTVSIGGAVFPQHGGSAATLIASADNALYLAKRHGRDGWAIAGTVPGSTSSLPT